MQAAHLAERRPTPGWPVILAGWGAVALAWTPPIALVQSPRPTAVELGHTALNSLLAFLPWALVTPALFALCRRVPFGVGRNGRALAATVVVGAVLLPLAALFLPLVQFLTALAGAAPGWRDWSWEQLLRRTAITALFAVPTYIAAIAIGQTLVWAERARVREELSARAEMKALRAELNPHFLYNTLGAIAELAHQAPARAEAAIVTLAQVLRSSLAVRADTHALADELGAVDEHLALHRALYGELRLDRRVDDALWHAAVPVHILMPLVENAMTHGAVDAAGSRWVRIEAEAVAGGMAIRVVNPVPVEAHPSAGLSSGIENVRQRLAMAHGERAALDTRRDGPDFVATLTLPA